MGSANTTVQVRPGRGCCPGRTLLGAARCLNPAHRSAVHFCLLVAEPTSPKLSVINDWVFFYAPGFCGLGTQKRQREESSLCSTVSRTSAGKTGRLGRLDSWGWNPVKASSLTAGLTVETGCQLELLHKPLGVVALHELAWASSRHGSWVPGRSVPGSTVRSMASYDLTS